MRPSNKFQVSADSYQGKTFSAININKSKWYIMMSGDDEVGQHVSSINKPVPQEVFVHWKIKK